MPVNLIHEAKNLFNSDVTSRSSSQFGESESGISKAVNGIIPLLFGGLLHRVNSADGSNAVASMVKEQESSGMTGNLENYFSGNSDLRGRGTGLLGGLFGNRTNVISDLISNYSGVKTSTASSLLGMALPAILGLIGRHASGRDPQEIRSLLNSQKDNIDAAIPNGLNLGSVTGSDDYSGSAVVSDVHETKPIYTTETTEKKESSTKWVLPLLIILGLAALAYFLFGRGCNDNETVTDDTDTTTVVTGMEPDTMNTSTSAIGRYDSATNDFIYDQGQNVTIDLPNNAGSLQVGENSTENRLYRFLSDGSSVIDTTKGNWFEFTNVKFRTGSAEITDESMGQLRNIVAITKGFPSAQLKIGGYTDNTGDASSNIALSQRRADAVAAKLKELGASSTAISGAEGYGPEWPVAGNDTPEGRAQNRRVAINVKSK